MASRAPHAKISLAFRFHVNFYHSYRGDTPDELGFGQDIRVIRKIIEALDDMNASGVAVRGTWDLENYFSLEKIMPKHCPDIIESLKRRVAAGQDEVQLMSYNNGLISAHTAAEFNEAIGRAITNEAGSGLLDLFGEYAPMVRPQEMMYTPMHLKLYRHHGVEYISLFYSAVPFNSFSNFISPLPLEQRYNPLTLAYPGIAETLTLVPAHNHGDLADNISLRWWLKRLRRKQLTMVEPKDLLLLIDADADDVYWEGYDVPVLSRLLAVARGLRGLVESACDLDYVTFTTPGEYVKTHPPLGMIRLGQDTADGSFDGFSSWAEKWSNHRLWTGVERSRILELQTRRLMSSIGASEERSSIERLLGESSEARLRSLSTTHFGLASPVVNRTRLRTVVDLLDASVEKASRAFRLGAEQFLEPSQDEEDSLAFTLFDYARGVSTESVAYETKASRALVEIPVSIGTDGRSVIRLFDADGTATAACIRSVPAQDGEAPSKLLFVVDMEAGGHKRFQVDFSSEAEFSVSGGAPVSVEEGSLANGLVTLRFDDAMQPVGFICSGSDFADGPLMRSALNYAGRIAEASTWSIAERAVLGRGLVGFVRLKSEIVFEAGGIKRAALEREFLLASGLPYLYATTRIVYPMTRSRNFDKRRARELEQEYDGNWREVMPCEIRPALFGQGSRPLRVWKHNYFGHVSYYDLDYGEFSSNAELDSFNNHVTNGWVAVTDGQKGILVAQSAEVNASLAFCPMRTRLTSGGTRIFLNPFGSYYGRQLRYCTAFTGLGRFIAVRAAPTLEPHAPSYNGCSEEFSQLIAPYLGNEPPEQIRNDAEAFAYPYGMVSRAQAIGPPGHRKWSYQ